MNIIVGMDYYKIIAFIATEQPLITPIVQSNVDQY